MDALGTRDLPMVRVSQAGEVLSCWPERCSPAELGEMHFRQLTDEADLT